jgi:hypothetical protein
VATPWALSFRLASVESRVSVYNLRHTAFEIPSKLDGGFLEWSRARPASNGRAWRLGGGLDYRSPRHGPLRPGDPEALAEGLRPPSLSDHRLAGIHGTWSLFTDAFRDFRDLAGMTHTEDYNLGLEATLRVGANLRSLGGEAGGPFLAAEASRGWLPLPSLLLLLRGEGGARREPGGWRDARFTGSATAYLMGLPRQTLAAYLQVDAADRPDLPNLLYLGGEDGLRGYANHLHLGDRRWILSVEERPITPINWLGILQLGFVAFLDAGAIRRADTGRWSRTYANLGGGLRFGDLKSSLGRVFLVTVAYPLVRDPGMDRYQVVIGNVVKF